MENCRECDKIKEIRDKGLIHIFHSDGLHFEYMRISESEETVLALHDINIDIQPGEFVAILGHNGSGKSTLARHLNALLIPTKGTLWVKGLDSKEPQNAWPIRQSTGMVFQNPDNQLVATIIEEDVAFGPENLGVESAEIRKRVDEALQNVGMFQYANSAPHQLSGGQKQRIAIAGVLAMRPDCIVLDEPTAMLDPSGRKEVLKTVTCLNKEAGITVILITHFMEEAVKAKRVIVMDKGSMVMDGTPHTIFKQVERMKSLGLDVPAPTALSHALIQKGFPMPPNILTHDDFITHYLNTSKKTGQRASPLQGQGTESLAGYGTPSHELDLNKKNIALEIKNLSHTYDKGTPFARTALENVSFAINAGECVGIIGHTGSGKSTLIQHFNGLLKPSEGEVLLNGENVFEDKSRLKSVRQRVGLVFQYPEHQLFEMNVYKDVAFGPGNMGLSQEEIDLRVKEALGLVGLGEEIYEKSPFELSGGQKRRAAIAGVLAMRPEVLVLDEPTAGLDPAGRDAILSQIAEMHKTVGNTVIMVSHSMEEVARLADRIFVMAGGRLILSGTPAEVFAQVERLESVGLAAPPISVLMNSLQSHGLDIPPNIFTVEDATEVLWQEL